MQNGQKVQETKGGKHYDRNVHLLVPTGIKLEKYENKKMWKQLKSREYQAEDPVEQFKDAMIKGTKDANFFDCNCFKSKISIGSKKYQKCTRGRRKM